jgi:hypothetical protein
MIAARGTDDTNSILRGVVGRVSGHLDLAPPAGPSCPVRRPPAQFTNARREAHKVEHIAKKLRVWSQGGIDVAVRNLGIDRAEANSERRLLEHPHDQSRE